MEILPIFQYVLGCISKISSLHIRKDTRIIFNGFSASFKSGQISAIIGDNGKGKSTLMYLATRLYIQSGNILINDIDINSICLEKYYGMISFMQQDSVVFNDTFINNLVLGKVYSEEEMLK